MQTGPRTTRRWWLESWDCGVIALVLALEVTLASVWTSCHPGERPDMLLRDRGRSPSSRSCSTASIGRVWCWREPTRVRYRPP
jgi:hypothetical protein